MRDKFIVGIHKHLNGPLPHLIECNIGSDYGDMVFWCFGKMGWLTDEEMILLKKIAERCPDLLEIKEMDFDALKGEDDEG